MEDNSQASWFEGVCKVCGYPVVTTQPDIKHRPLADYQYYCSNRECEHFKTSTHIHDLEDIPDWVETRKTIWVSRIPKK